MIVLDASVLIGHLDDRDPHHDRASELLRANAGTPFGASAVSLAETLVAPARAGKLEIAQDALCRLEIAELPFGEDAPPRLARLRAETGLKLPDCCVLLAAQDRGGIVASFDGGLKRSARALGLGAL